MINLFGESIPTREAREAQDILQHFSISLNLQEYQSLAETSRETERDSFGDIASTKAANEAKNILKNCSIDMTLDQYQTLKEQERETEQDTVFIGYTNPTKQAQIAQDILKNNISISDNQRIFTTDEIGKGTLEEQKDTASKQQEEKAIDEPSLDINLE